MTMLASSLQHSDAVDWVTGRASAL